MRPPISGTLSRISHLSSPPQTGYDLGIGSVVMAIAVSGGVAYVCTRKAHTRA